MRKLAYRVLVFMLFLSLGDESLHVLFLSWIHLYRESKIITRRQRRSTRNLSSENQGYEGLLAKCRQGSALFTAPLLASRLRCAS